MEKSPQISIHVKGTNFVAANSRFCSDALHKSLSNYSLIHHAKVSATL